MDKNNMLWMAASNYQKARIADGAYSVCAHRSMMADASVLPPAPKCKANYRWVLALWEEYYKRKTDMAAGGQMNLDFSSMGNLPYPMSEIMLELK